MSKLSPEPRAFEPQSGERLADEGRQAYLAFSVYRSMPVTERGIRGVAKKLGKSKSLIERWSSKHKWVERIRGCDQEQEKVEIDEQEKAHSEMVRRHAATGKVLTSVRLQISGILTKRLPELEAHLTNMPLQRLNRRQLTMLPMLMRLQKEQREAYLLLEELEPTPLRVVEESEEPRDKDVTAIHLNACPCRKSHDKSAQQWPCESAKAYAAFKDYRETGEERSIRAIGRKRKQHRSQLQRWAARYEWSRRAEIYDKQQQQLAQGTDPATRAKILRREIAEIESILEKLKLITQVCIKRAGELKHLSMDSLFKLVMLNASKSPAFQKGELEALTFMDFKVEKRDFEETLLTYAPQSVSEAAYRLRNSARFRP